MRLIYGDLDLTDYPYALEFGMDVGAPENVSQALAFLLQDGEVELSSRSSNRTLAFNVLIEGADLAEMATAEQALILETDKPMNEITIDPEDFGPASVYETFRGQVTLQRDDNGEIGRLRRYQVTVRALPFVRSEDELTSVALPATGTTTTTLDACTATTGWTGSINGATVTPSAAGGAVSVSQSNPPNDQYTFALQKTFAATTTTTKLLMVDWKPSTGSGSPLVAIGDGVTLPIVAEGASPTSGYVRSWFKVAASSLAVVRFEWFTIFSASPGARPALSLSLDNVAVTDVPPVVGTGRQQLLALSLNGSAPTQGSLAVQSETTSLGETLIYTYPADETTDGYTPPLRQFRTSGGTVTADSTTVSGSREPISGSGCTIQVPLNLLPRGTYVLVVRLGAPAGFSLNTTFTWAISTTLGSNAIGPTTRTTPVVTVPAGAFANYTLGRLSLPTVDLDPFTPAKLNIQFSVATSNVLFDEAWLYNTDIGQLTWVDCGSGTAAVGGPAKRLFLESPSVDKPRPGVQIGHTADRSDAFYPVGAVKSWQGPRMAPPTLKVHTVTTNATDAVVSARYTPAWHTNAAS